METKEGEEEEEEECEKCEAVKLSHDIFHAPSLKDKGKIFKYVNTGKFEMLIASDWCVHM